MKASVIMPVYNERLDWLQYSIDSVLNQTFSDFEFLIILDDPMREDLKYYLKILENRDKRIRVYFNEKNIGIFKSLNILLGKCKGEYVFRMDADDICQPDRFFKQLEFMKKNNLDFCATLCEIIDKDGIVVGYSKNNGNFGKRTIKRVIKYKPILPHPTW